VPTGITVSWKVVLDSMTWYAKNVHPLKREGRLKAALPSLARHSIPMMFWYLPTHAQRSALFSRSLFPLETIHFWCTIPNEEPQGESLPAHTREWVIPFEGGFKHDNFLKK
jgi:hypothetical protein